MESLQEVYLSLLSMVQSLELDEQDLFLQSVHDDIEDMLLDVRVQLALRATEQSAPGPYVCPVPQQSLRESTDLQPESQPSGSSPSPAPQNLSVLHSDSSLFPK